MLYFEELRAGEGGGALECLINLMHANDVKIFSFTPLTFSHNDFIYHLFECNYLQPMCLYFLYAFS